MADEQHVTELLREADPARQALGVPAELDPLWQTITARVETGHDPEGDPNMSTRLAPPSRTRTGQDTPPDPHGRAGRTEWLARAAIITAVAAGIAVALWTLTRLGADPEVVTDGQGIPTPVHDLVEAFNDGDQERIESLLTADATTVTEGRPLVGETSKVPQWNRNMFAFGAQLEVESCDRAESELPGTVFSCRMTGSTTLSRALGEQHQADIDLRIVEDGRIAGHDMLAAAVDPRGSSLEQLGAYLYDNHFEAYDEACGATYDPLLVDTTCMEFLERYVDEFVAAR